MTTKQIFYRLEGDRKFFSADESAVINYAKNKKNLTDTQVNELKQFGVTQDGKCGIMQFTSK